MSPDNQFTQPSEQKQEMSRKEWNEIVHSCLNLSGRTSNLLYDVASVFAAIYSNSQFTYKQRLYELSQRRLKSKDDLIVRWLADAFMHIADDGTNMQLSRVASDIFDALDDSVTQDSQIEIDNSLNGS